MFKTAVFFVKNFYEKDNQRFIEIEIPVVEKSEKLEFSARVDMVEQFKSEEIPLFIQRSEKNPYGWRDVFGKWVDGRLSADNKVITAVCRLNQSHPDHELFWNYLKNKMPVGFSLGFIPTTFYYLEEKNE
jgi:hypothetical protein